jgi:hypothetical protein|tara:strand:- start:4451 stop:4738 length:288 start_codon:yes stop_codon:yes gene_type:complete
MTDEEQEEYQVECTTEEAEAIEKVILNALRKHNNPNAIAVIIGLSNALLTASIRAGMRKLDFFRLLREGWEIFSAMNEADRLNIKDRKSQKRNLH